MSDSSGLNREMDNAVSADLTGKVVVMGVIALLFFVLIFVLFLHLYAKWFWYRQEEQAAAAAAAATTRRRRRRLDFAAGYVDPPLAAAAAGLRRGLNPSILKSLPVVIFNSNDFTKELECAVCLSEIADGEKARLLPKCNHGFHLDCIDMWFQSHSTCPLCRNPVSKTQFPNDQELAIESVLSSSMAENSTEPQNLPTNVLFWGDHNQVSTFGSCLEDQSPCSSSSPSSSSTGNRGDGMLVIDIPSQAGEEEEGGGAKTPVSTRMRSLKRLLSRDRRVNPSGGDANVDLELVESRGQS